MFGHLGHSVRREIVVAASMTRREVRDAITSAHGVVLLHVTSAVGDASAL